MSTKIYNGYKLTGVTTLKDLVEFSKNLAAKLQQVKEQQYAKLVAEEVTDLIDLVSTGRANENFLEKNGKSSYLYCVEDKLSDRAAEIKRTNRRDPSVDFSSEVTYFPLNKTTVLAMWFCENREMTELWEKQTIVEEYHYQNQVDKPDHISDKEWGTRRNNWDKVLPGCGVPAANGLSFTFTDYYVFTAPIEETLKQIPSFEKRLQKLTKNIYVSDYVKKQMESIPEDVREGNDYINFYYEAKENIAEEKADAELEIIKNRIEPLLHKEITKDILLMNIQSSK